MKYLTQQKFSFVCDSLDEETFGVVMFKGFEALSRPFEFDIMLVTDEPDVDMDAAMNHTARLAIHETDGADVTIRGILSGFEQLHQTGPYFFYRAILVPRLWFLTLNQNNQVFINQSLDDIISRQLKGVGLFQNIDFEFSLKSPCPPKEYVCQYGESHFNFISRWLEHDGLYYFFDQTESGEKIIFTDSNICHTDLKIHPSLSYTPASGQETLRREQILTSLSCRRRQLPHDILLKDYNYEKPSMNVEGRAVVDENGRGSVYSYGEHFTTSEEADALAGIRADELRCRKKEFFCESCVPDVTAGYTFRLTDHFTQAFNQKYLIVEVMHQGSQTGYLISGIRKALAHLEQEVAYRNSFTAIPADAQFRAQRKTARPLMPGTLHATVDAAGSGDYPELDAKGRYKIRLPFDIHSTHLDGKASCFIRMLQPHAGPPVTDQSRGQQPSGFHLPLRKNTEVLLTFINGDPDRPVIAGAVPNPLTRSTVDENNQTRNIFRDHFGNEMIFDSTPGDEHIRLYSPHHNSGWELGRSEVEWTDSDKTALLLGDSVKAGLGSDSSFTGGFGIDVLGGARIGGTIGAEHNVLVGASHNWTLGYRWEWSKGPFVQSTSKDAMITAREDIILGAGDEFCMAAGTQRPKDDSKYDIANENKSVIRATRKGITLSLGSELGETAEGNGKARWFYAQDAIIEDDTKWALANGASLLAFAGSMAGLLESIRENSKGGKAVSGIAMTIFMLTAAITAKHLHRNNLSDSMIEPATHKKPSQKIWMYKDGTIGIVSTKGSSGGKTETGDDGKITIGVNEQIDGESNSQFFYNAQNKVSSAPVKSKFKDFLGFESPNSPDPKPSYTKLGQGANIIIKKDYIDIREGGTDPEGTPDSQILVTKDNGVKLKVNDEQKTSYISIAKPSGNITLNTIQAKEGDIILDSKGKISMTTGRDKNIELKAQGTGEITFQSRSVNVKAKINQRNLTAEL